MATSKAIRLPIAFNKKYQSSGLKSYVYLLNKYNIAPKQPGPYHREAKGGLMKVLADGTSGAVTADDQQNDAFYTVAVQIGTPPQTVNLDFDSGSSDLWVKSTELSQSVLSQTESAGVAVFDPSKSTTFQKVQGATWQISYGDGSSASGDVGTDTLLVGNISVEGQAIETANTMSASFVSESSSGLLGLAWGSINTVKPTPVKTPVENMIAQKDITQALFTVNLGSVENSTADDSFYTFGAIDETVVQQSGQQISYTPVDNSQGFWMYDSPSMTIAGKTVQTSGNTSILDTGTTLALVADEIVTQIYAQVPGAKYDNTQQGWLIPTADVASRPIITFAIGGTQFAIAKELLAFTETSGGMSYGAIQSRGSMTFDIMGDTMLKNIYAIFDVGNVRLGAVQRSSSSAQQPSSGTVGTQPTDPSTQQPASGTTHHRTHPHHHHHHHEQSNY